jgi:hypothetical protein
MHQLTSDPSPGAAGLRLEVTVEDDAEPAIGLEILEFKYGFDSQTRGTRENRRTIRTISDARYEPHAMSPSASSALMFAGFMMRRWPGSLERPAGPGRCSSFIGHVCEQRCSGSVPPETDDEVPDCGDGY